MGHTPFDKLMRIFKAVSLFCKMDFFKTIYFNLKYFPLKQALLLPVFVYRHAELFKMNGRIEIHAPLKTGMVKIGLYGLGRRKGSRLSTVWEMNGTVIVQGEVYIGRGSRIIVEGVLTLGDGFCITGDSSIICHKEMAFGNDCLLSRRVLVIDTDYQHVLCQTGEIIGMPEPVQIGNHVRIGAGNTVLKGMTIADSTVIPDHTKL